MKEESVEIVELLLKEIIRRKSELNNKISRIELNCKFYSFSDFRLIDLKDKIGYTALQYGKS